MLVPVYWREYGPANFLWFSDIALFAIVIGLWTRHPLPGSMTAVGVLLLEVVWAKDEPRGGTEMTTNRGGTPLTMAAARMVAAMA